MCGNRTRYKQMTNTDKENWFKKSHQANEILEPING